jgi:hypothetical protein
MTEKLKRKTLIILGSVIIIIMILAASLSQLNLQPGMPLPELKNNQTIIESNGTTLYESMTFNKYIILGILSIIGGLFLFMIYKLIRGTGWKSLLTLIKLLSLIILIALIVLFLISFSPGFQAPLLADLIISFPKTHVSVSQLTAVPPWMIWMIGIALLVVTVATGILIFRYATKQKTIMTSVGLEAKKAWQDIEAGQTLKNVIINCYRQMSILIKESSKLEREDSMTTQEFEDLLKREGVPYEPIHQLTQLFDAARYGDWRPGPTDEQKAINCLEALMHFSSEPKKEK